MNRWRAYALAGLFFNALATGAAIAAPMPLIPPASPPTEAPALLLEVVINGKPSPTLAMLRTLPDGCDQIEADALRQAGLYSGDDPAVCLGRIAGLDYELDREGARIEIFAETLAPQSAGRARDRPKFARALPGLIGQYGLSMQTVETPRKDYRAGFGDLALTFHSGWGRLQSDQVATWDGDALRVERLATAYEKDFPDEMMRLTLGDSFTRAPRWGRLTAFAGVQFGTDFSMDPAESFRPYRTFQTLLREQSEIDVRVNGVVRQRTSVDPGFNEVQIVPEAGRNDIEIAIRDASGLTRIEDASFFASPSALAPGVTDFSASLGVPRRFFGARSDYSDTLLASGFVRRGMSNAVTAEAHAEIGEAVQVIGGGAEVVAGNVGILNIAAAVSESREADRGHLLAAGLDRSTRMSTVQLQVRVADETYTDSAAQVGAAFPDLSVRASAGVFTPAGSFRTSFNAQNDRILRDRRFVSVGWEKALGRGQALLAASGFHDIRRGETGATLSLRMTFGGYSGRVRRDSIGGLDFAAVEVSRARLEGERLQWSLQASEGRRADTLRGDLQADLGAADLYLQAGKYGGTHEVSAGVRGSFTAMKSHVVLSRQTTPATALVHVPGVSGIPVYQDNRRVAVTDRNGEAVITGVRPFEVNRISLRPEDLPLDYTITDFELDFVPRRGLAEVSFDTQRETALGFTVLLPDGAPLAPGSRVELVRSGARCPVGMEGRVFCVTAEDDDTVRVVTPAGSFTAPVATLRQTGRMQLGPDAGLRFAGIS